MHAAMSISDDAWLDLAQINVKNIIFFFFFHILYVSKL